MRRFYQSPLPFQGQKRNFLKEFKKYLKHYSDEYVFVDLFGGSGLLSHTVKQIYPQAKVVYNDFDNFTERLSNIENTNKILEQLRVILSDYPRKQKITGAVRDTIIEILKQANNHGFVDWITLSASLKFSMNYCISFSDFKKGSMYNRVRKANIPLANHYLQGVEVVCQDYYTLFNKYKNKIKVVYLVDPPYLNTDTATYGSNNYWKLQDYLNVLRVLNNQNYFYFTSDKSQIVELCEWISSVSTVANPFANATKKIIKTSTTHNTGYTDIMYFYKK